MGVKTWDEATPRDVIQAAARVLSVRARQCRNDVYWLESEYSQQSHQDRVRAYTADLGILADHLCAMMSEKGLI